MNKDSKTIITNTDQKDIQPNAVDIKLDQVFKIENDTFVIDNNDKTHRTHVQVHPDKDDWFHLEIGLYQVIMINDIFVGLEEAGWVITRSTFIRNGCYLVSGLYDSGYQGPMVSLLHVNCGPIKIKRGTRIGQYLSFSAEMKHTYSGNYGF